MLTTGWHYCYTSATLYKKTLPLVFVLFIVCFFIAVFIQQDVNIQTKRLIQAKNCFHLEKCNFSLSLMILMVPLEYASETLLGMENLRKCYFGQPGGFFSFEHCSVSKSHTNMQAVGENILYFYKPVPWSASQKSTQL